MSGVAVLGAGGMLGHKVCQALSHREVYGLVRRPATELAAREEIFAGVTLVGGIDVLVGERLEEALTELRPEAVVNCVGLVKQLEEATDPCLAVAINALLPHRLARLCAELGARLVHVSTDCVFDGTRGAYRESDLADARDLYGRSKALGETLPQEPVAVTLRTSFIGRELKAKTHGLLEWLLASAGGTVDGWARVIYSGLTSLELADVVRRVLERHPDLHGVYQVASEPISKYDLLHLIRHVYDLDVEIRKTAEPVSDRSLVSEAFRQATGWVAPSWSDMITRLRDDPTPYDGPRAVLESPA